MGNGEKQGNVVLKSDFHRFCMIGESVQSLGPGFSTFGPLAAPSPGKKRVPVLKPRPVFCIFLPQFLFFF